MYFSDLGFIALILAAAFAIFAILAAIVGARRGNIPLISSAKRSALAVNLKHFRFCMESAACDRFLQALVG